MATLSLYGQVVIRQLGREEVGRRGRKGEEKEKRERRGMGKERKKKGF